MQRQPPAHSDLFAFTPFPRNSVNLVTGPTNVGKTFFVTQLLNNHSHYFQSPVKRIFVVLCNDRVQPLSLDDAEDVVVEQIPLSDFTPDLLSADDLVVIDDVQSVTDAIRMTISVAAHHYDLASLFVVTHSLLGHSNFELLNLCHRVFLFMRAQSNNRLAKYIMDHFYQDPELKASLKEILSFCQRHREVLCLELAAKGDADARLPLLGMSHLSCVPTENFCLVYPHPHSGMEYAEAFESRVSVEPSIGAAYDFNNLPKYALVAVPAKSVSLSAVKKSSESACSKRQEWEETLLLIEDMIESFFKSHRWQICKNLAAEILRNNRFCVYKDGRYFHKKNKPKALVSLMDFLNVVTRPGSSFDKTDKPELKLYKEYALVLLNCGSPPMLFRNKGLLGQ